MIIRSKVLRTDEGQFVELPNDVAFPEHIREVEIINVGQSRVITAIGHLWYDFFQSGPRASGDFMAERADPPAEERDEF